VSVLIRFNVAPDSFVLADAPGLRVELERIVTFDQPKPSYAWVPETDTEAFEGAADEACAIESVTQVEGGDRSFYRVDWTSDRPSLIDVLDDTDGVVLGCRLRERLWEFRVRFPDADSVRRFQKRHARASFEVEVMKVLSVEEESEEPPMGLTSKQYLALRSAYQLGYFERPRDVTLAELATHFEVSAQSMSGLLRRGMKNLLEEEIPLEAIEENIPTSADSSLSWPPESGS
jgi:predicted DNA binding protein